MTLRFLLMVCLLSAPLLGSCAARHEQAAAGPAEEQPVDLEAVFAPRQSLAPVDPHPGAVPSHLNSPRAAAQEIATRSGSIDKRADRHVQLHAALYRAAINADEVRHPAYLLVAVADEDVDAFQSVSPREFRLRVLAALTALSMPVAWDCPDKAWMLDDRAPGGGAARAWFEVVHEDDALATIEADVCIESWRQGTWKQRVEAIYDGERWAVRDLGARTTW
jgi:hypothetical protein